MPIPEPTNEESQSDFIDRCMADETMAEEFPDADQRRAAVLCKWDEARAKPVAPNDTGERIWRAITTDIEFESRATRDGTESVISGYGSVYYDGTPGTEFGLTENLIERIKPGAFSRALRNRVDVLGLFNHNPDLILGRTSAGTMELADDKKGLRYTIRLPKTGAGADVLESIRRRDVTGSSFSFRPVKRSHQTVGDMNIVTIEDVELYDVGPVTFPAYRATSAEINQRDIRDQMENFVRLRHHADVERQREIDKVLEEVQSRTAQLDADDERFKQMMGLR